MKPVLKIILGAALFALLGLTAPAQTILVANTPAAYGLSSYDFGPVIISAFYGETVTVPNAAISSSGYLGVNSTVFGTDSGLNGINDRDTTFGGVNQERLRIEIKPGYYLTNLTWDYSRADGPLATDGVTISGFKSDPGAVFSGGLSANSTPTYSAGKLNFQITAFNGTVQTITFTNINATANDATLEIVTSDSTQAGPQFALRNLTVAVVPTAIITQPVPATRYEQDGTNVFSVVATSPLPLSYQWYQSPASVISGATNQTLTLHNLTTAQAGNYFLVATNTSGAALTSSVVSLTVNAWTAPSFAMQPVSATVNVGQRTNFTAVATGSPQWSLSYQWTKGGTPIAGATSNVLTFAYPLLTNSGNYYVTVTNTLGTSNSETATLTVLAPLFPHKSIFASGGLFNQQVADLRNSGFDTAILWSVHVSGSGALNLNNDALVNASGTYVYGQWARDNCALLKQAPTTIKRIEFSVGSAGAADFEGIEGLVNSGAAGGGTGPGSILRRNFQALRDAFPQVDAINFDDESNYDVPSTTAFAVMLVDLGYKITFCPYTQRTTFWQPLYQAIEAARPGAVDHVYLQRYAGGASQNPATWNTSFGSLKVEPGLWAGLGTASGRSDPSEVETAMNNWRVSADIPGGFIWRLDYATEGGHTIRDYAAAINGTYSAVFDATKHYKFINRYSGKAMMARDETIAGVPFVGTNDNAEIAQGTYNGDDPRFHWRIEDVGSGFRKITSRYSALAITVFETTLDGLTATVRTNNGAEIGQWQYLGDQWYQWRLTDTGAGYKLVNRYSGKAAAIFAANTAGAPLARTADGADVGQWQYLGDAWYNWDIIDIKPLRVESLVAQGGMLQLVFAGEPFASLLVQSAPALTGGNWTDEQTVQLDAAGQGVFSRLMPTEATRFYRGRSPLPQP